MDWATGEIKAEAMKEHKYKDRNGNLTASHYNKVEQEGDIFIGTVGNSSEVALFQHEGVEGPYDITPVDIATTSYKRSKGVRSGAQWERKALAWETPDGEVHFSKKVTHPGIDPDPWIVRALHQKKNRVQQLFGKAVGKSAREAARASNKS